MSDETQVRAKWTRTALARVPLPIADAVFASLAPEVRSAVEGASVLGWIPVADHIELCRGWHAALGDQAFRTLFRNAFLDAVDAPLLSAIVMGSVRVFGSTPVGATRAWTVGWPYIFRRGGHAAVEVLGPRQLAVHITGLPPAMRDESFALGCAGSCEGNATLVGVRGHVTHDTAALADGALTLRLDW